MGLGLLGLVQGADGQGHPSRTRMMRIRILGFLLYIFCCFSKHFFDWVVNNDMDMMYRTGGWIGLLMFLPLTGDFPVLGDDCVML